MDSAAFFNRINTKKTGRKDEVVVWMDREVRFTIRFKKGG